MQWRIQNFTDGCGERGGRQSLSLGRKPIITGCNEVVAKIIFLHLSVILFTGGCLPQCMLGCQPPRSRHPPGADTPQGRHPQEQTPPPKADPPRADKPQEQTPPQKRKPPKSRHPPKADTPPKADPPKSRHLPKKQMPAKSRHPPPPSRHPPRADIPPPREAPGIWSMSGRYASYWNAFLFNKNFNKNYMKMKKRIGPEGALETPPPPPPIRIR